jgi:hypothetical protein
MKEQQGWKIVESHLAELVELMIAVPKGAAVDVFCDPAGKKLSVAKPSGDASVKLCAVSAPDLENSYGLRPGAAGFVNDDGEEIPKERLAAYLARYIAGAKDGGAEWGWEFKLNAD